MPVAVALASMTGLALGVGYSLLILDRCPPAASIPGRVAPRRRAQRPRSPSRRPGARCCSRASGLILALLLATAIAPTKILVSLGIGVLLCSALAVGGAVVVMPAALVLLGGRAAACERRRARGAHARLGPARRGGRVGQARRQGRGRDSRPPRWLVARASRLVAEDGPSGRQPAARAATPPGNPSKRSPA